MPKERAGFTGQTPSPLEPVTANNAVPTVPNDNNHYHYHPLDVRPLLVYYLPFHDPRKKTSPGHLSGLCKFNAYIISELVSHLQNP